MSAYNQLYYDKLSRKEAIKVALDNGHLDGIKYIYASKSENYLTFYDQFGNVQALNRAEKLKDVKGIDYIQKKIGSSSFAYLYDSQKTIQDKLKKAQEYNDLEGFKYILKPYGKDYKEVLYILDKNNPNIKDDIQGKLYYASVMMEDAQGLDYILQEAKLSFPQELAAILKDHTQILRDVYYRSNFNLAYKLIEAGAKFDALFIVRPKHNLQQKYGAIEKHINKLKSSGFITEQEHKHAISLVKTLYHQPLKIMKIGELGYSSSEVVKSTTFVDDNSKAKIHNTFEQYVSSKKQPVKDVFKFAALTNLEGKQISIFLPIDGKFSDPHYSGNIILSPHKDYYIYTPIDLQETASALMHEMGHFFFDTLFNNTAKPYSEQDYINKQSRYLKYEESAVNTLTNLAGLLKEQQSVQLFNSTVQIASYLKGTAPLLLNHYIYEYRQKKVTDAVLENSLLKAYSPQSANLQQLYNLPSAQKIKVLEDVYKKYGWSDDESYLLERITDYVMRDQALYDVELLNRLPELQVKSLNNKALTQLKPLAEYWTTFITPEISKLITDHINACKALLAKGHNVGASNFYCILDLYDKKDATNLALNSETRCSLIENLINSFAYQNGEQSDQLRRANAEKELLYSSKIDKQNLCLETILNKYVIPQETIFRAYLKASENGYSDYLGIFSKHSAIPIETQQTALKLSLEGLGLCPLSQDFFSKCNDYFSGFGLSIGNERGSYMEVGCTIYNNLIGENINPGIIFQDILG